MNEKELLDLFQSEIEKQGALAVWTSEPEHFCDIDTNPVIMVVMPKGVCFNFEPFARVWEEPHEDAWENFDWTDKNSKFAIGGFHKKMYKVYDKGVWTLHA